MITEIDVLLTGRWEHVRPGLGEDPRFGPAAAERTRCASVTSDPTESCESLSPAVCACAPVRVIQWGLHLHHPLLLLYLQMEKGRCMRELRSCLWQRYRLLRHPLTCILRLQKQDLPCDRADVHCRP